MQIEILSMAKPDKGNVKITANILTPAGVPPETTYISVNDTPRKRDEMKLAYETDIAERGKGLEEIARLHLGTATLTQEGVDE